MPDLNQLITQYQESSSPEIVQQIIDKAADSSLAATQIIAAFDQVVLMNNKDLEDIFRSFLRAIDQNRSEMMNELLFAATKKNRNLLSFIGKMKREEGKIFPSFISDKLIEFAADNERWTALKVFIEYDETLKIKIFAYLEQNEMIEGIQKLLLLECCPDHLKLEQLLSTALSNPKKYKEDFAQALVIAAAHNYTVEEFENFINLGKELNVKIPEVLIKGLINMLSSQSNNLILNDKAISLIEKHTIFEKLKAKNLAFQFIQYLINNSKHDFTLTDKILKICLSRFPNNIAAYEAFVAHSLQLPIHQGDSTCMLAIKECFNSEAILPQTKQALMNHLFTLCLKFKNAALIQTLHEMDPYYEVAQAGLTKIRDRVVLRELLTHREPINFSHYMMQFTRGFGNINMEGGLLTVSEVSNRKQDAYTYQPTLLKSGEFEEFLATIKKASPPIRERFINTGGHWCGGEISIDENGVVKLFLIDSMGAHAHYEQFARMIAEAFPVIPPNQHTIYINNTKRQHGHSACQTFALDDMRHLHTAERYLSEKESIFDYLQRKKISSQPSISGINIVVSELPLSLMRTMQSRELHQIIAQRDLKEQIAPIKKVRENKEPMTAAKSAKQDFAYVQEENREKNLRLERNLYHKIAHANYKYLINNPMDLIRQEMQRFTLSGLKQRIQYQNETKHENQEVKVRKTPRALPMVSGYQIHKESPAKSHDKENQHLTSREKKKLS